jgi:hypothetical protein
VHPAFGYPYNKEYNDLSSQLRLFVPEDQDIGVRPEKYLAEIGEIASRRSISALCAPSRRSSTARMPTIGAT